MHRLVRERFVLVASRSEDKVATKPEPMNHSMVAQCLTRSFAKAEVFQGKNSFTRVSCSRRRFSIITELIWGRKNQKILPNVSPSMARKYVSASMLNSGTIGKQCIYHGSVTTYPNSCPTQTSLAGWMQETRVLKI